MGNTKKGFLTDSYLFQVMGFAKVSTLQAIMQIVLVPTVTVTVLGLQ